MGLSSITIKVKGVAQTNLSIHYPIKNKTTWGVFNQGHRTWDSADFVTPPEVGSEWSGGGGRGGGHEEDKLPNYSINKSKNFFRK